MNKSFALCAGVVLAIAIGCVGAAGQKPSAPSKAPEGFKKVIKTDAEWKKALSSKEYEILRHADTEQAFTGRYWDLHEKGTFACAGCGTPLFSSETKFDSGTGWPSFYAPLKKDRVTNHVDTTYGMARTEVVCSTCDGHLGHVFDDGPKPTGLRYCMNGYALKFIKAKSK